MTSLEALRIDLFQVTEEEMQTSCELAGEFFQKLDAAEIQNGTVNATLSIRKTTVGEFLLQVGVSGSVTVSCDLCLDDMEQPVENKADFVVRLGDEADDDGDTVVVDERSGVLDASWLVYETIALAVPIKHVHAPGKCNAAMTEKLNELSATRSGDEAAVGDIDPRWAGLMKLK